MKIDDLQKFCATDFEMLGHPFSVGGCTYATTGSICVRVPRVSGVDAEQPSKVRVNELTFYDASGIYKEIPEYKQPEKVKCGNCRGTGFASKCPECLGDGCVNLENDFHEYECDCKSCRGEGTVAGGHEKCKDCNGSGLVNKDRYEFIDIGDLRINTNLLDMIKDLPDVKINTTSKEYAMFVFNGGDGLIMPMTKD